MNLDPKFLADLLRLARLRLDEEEVERLRRDLGRILEYVAALDEIDVDQAEDRPPPEEVPPFCRLREDRIERGLTQEEALAGAPEVVDGQFAVPVVVPSRRRGEGESCGVDS